MSKMVRMGSIAILTFAAAIQLAGSGWLLAQETEPPQEPPKPYLGVIVEQGEESTGVIVIDLDPKGPAGTAGLKPGDVIESINGVAIAKTDDMGAALKGQGVGATLKFVVKREEKSVTANVKLIAAPSGAPAGGVEVEKGPGEGGAPPPLPDPDAGVPSAPSVPGPARPYLGLTVVPHARGGAAISSIRKDSPAARVGFPLGGVIIRVNETPVDKPDDLIDFIAAMEPGKEVELSYMHNERLYRKTVKLSAIGGAGVASKVEMEDITPPPAPLPSQTPRASTPAPKEDRPIIDGIGRILNNGGLVPGVSNTTTQQQVNELRTLVEMLEARIAKLEAELAAMKPAKLGEPAVPATPADPLR
jgi:predicted metalloprotease with PDZ domain